MALRRPGVRIPLGPHLKAKAGVVDHPSASWESEVRAQQCAERSAPGRTRLQAFQNQESQPHR